MLIVILVFGAACPGWPAGPAHDNKSGSWDTLFDWLDSNKERPLVLNCLAAHLITLLFQKGVENDP